MPSPALSPASSLALARARPASAAPEALGGGAVWRADELARNVGATRPTGHAVLDAVLPGGGWPVGALVEVLQLSMDAQGIPFRAQNQLLAQLAPMHRDTITEK